MSFTFSFYMCHSGSPSTLRNACLSPFYGGLSAFAEVAVPESSVYQGFSEHPHILSYSSRVTGRPRDLLKVKARPLVHDPRIDSFTGTLHQCSHFWIPCRQIGLSLDSSVLI